MQHFMCKPQGVCARLVEFDLDGDTVHNISFVGGCNGNLKGICQLLKGMKAEDAITRMKGTTCGSRPTSCPDQISHALEEALARLN